MTENVIRPGAPRHAFRNIALFARSTEAQVARCMLNLGTHLSSQGLRVLTSATVQATFPAGITVACEEREFVQKADLVIAIGGDGTLLRAAHLVAGQSIPLLGINQGRLGFLTDISPSYMREDVDRILSGSYIEDRRTVLEARIERDGDDVLQGLALNDVVVQRAGQGRILDFETFIDGRVVNAHRGDGLVVATATGSTAYALSCGGPIVMPDLDALVVTPVCPHTLSDRPLMVRLDRMIEVRLALDCGEVNVCCDGVLLGNLVHGDRLSIRQAASKVILLHSPDYDYFRLIRSKLHWGRGEATSVVSSHSTGPEFQQAATP